MFWACSQRVHKFLTNFSQLIQDLFRACFYLLLTYKVQVNIVGSLNINYLPKIQWVTSLSWSELGTAQPQLVSFFLRHFRIIPSPFVILQYLFFLRYHTLHPNDIIYQLPNEILILLATSLLWSLFWSMSNAFEVGDLTFTIKCDIGL